MEAMKTFAVGASQIAYWAYAWHAIVGITDAKDVTWYATTPNPYLSGHFFEDRHEAEDAVMCQAIQSLPLSRRISGKEPQFEL